MMLVLNLNPSVAQTLAKVVNALLGVAHLVGTVVLMLLSAFPDGVKIWCLSGHVGNMMLFLDTATPVGDMIAGIIGNMMLMCVGAFMAFSAAALPWPFMANRKARAGVQRTALLFRILIRDIVTAYTGDGSEFDDGGAVVSK